MKFKGLIGSAFSKLEIKNSICYLDGMPLPNVMTYKVILDGEIPMVILEIPINELTTDQIEN